MTNDKATTNHHYVDLLILAALPKETLILDRIFSTEGTIFGHDFVRLATERTIKMPCVEVSLREGGTIRLAWMNLDGMCNVFAYDKALQAISAACPRCVLMIGMAAGRSPYKRGDVTFANYIGYSSHQKVESEPLSTWLNEASPLKGSRKKKKLISNIQDTLRQLGITPEQAQLPKTAVRGDPELISCWAGFTDEAEKKALENVRWHRAARSWWKQFRGTYLRKHGGPKGRLEDQKEFERPAGPKAHQVIVASGEAVIANTKLLASISDVVRIVSKRTQEDSRATVFEMEAYGVGRCCQRFDIPFAFVKGISDFGGDDKGTRSRTKDSFHFAAIASATAFSLDVALDGNFLSALQNKPHCGWGRSACIWSSLHEKPDGLPPFPCYKTAQFDDSTVLRRLRPCTKTELLGIGKTELLGSRILEDVDIPDYSKCLSRLVEQNDQGIRDHHSRLILIFPYDVPSLLDFFTKLNLEHRDASAKLSTHVDNIRGLLDPNSAPGGGAQLPKAAARIGIVVHEQLTHFSEINRRCAQAIESGVPFRQLARQYCRVIYLPPMRIQDLLQQPAFLMHISTCGVCVPTLLALESNSLHLDEATYVIKQHGWCPPERPVTVCMKHLPRSKLLAIASTCNVRPKFGEYGKVFDFSERVQDWIESFRVHGTSGQAASDLNLFPVATLLDRYGIPMKDVYPLDGHYKKTRVKHYFERLRIMESALHNL